uniref:Uncharacterized protein n=1 Tax=Palpitomonas bilix TaxID=652834 RepID=A0A7S3GEQ1_9EUKA|mmetsp:Transcript_46424/g.119822  ORF Transcript_46424/g.119822 Transcript_46424/m.119822 type:complete len:197 (+) Transcript_46424:309-899(+)|eukprot:CAMPEP_0113902900 /NCGR_PEP_ID=MMETSP0780_2-20120614/22145_1 /TAXON_ID=652834 /ORGANISM="Palpitomonas bilix" /LENGTH=196 /DNA_ID=CAMNT_0000895833 /DNA_START=246 /DNA_END=836 /DNA_ORIENTATION=+ /assembly_acc=CAM_ASM_000599
MVKDVDDSKSYKKVKKGKLTFKGGEEIAKKKKKSKSKVNLKDINLMPIPGSGRISSTGSSVMGMESHFSKEVKEGDWLLIRNQARQEVEEMKKVKRVMSDISLILEDGFGVDLVTPATYKIINVPRDDQGRVKDVGGVCLDDLVKERQKNILTYRERVGGAFGGYRIKAVAVEGETTKEDLLDMRSKKKSDRYCMI